MNNNLAGLVQLTLGEKTHTLRYDWNGIAELTQEFPDGYNLMNPSHLSKLIVIGLRHEVPDITAEQVMAASPPIISTMEVVGAAINCAYFGTAQAPEPAEGSSDEENPPRKKVARRA